jgi:hypothetical protein
MHYWWIYNTIQAARYYNIKYDNKDLECLTEEIQREKVRREMEIMKR